MKRSNIEIDLINDNTQQIIFVPEILIKIISHITYYNEELWVIVRNIDKDMKFVCKSWYDIIVSNVKSICDGLGINHIHYYAIINNPDKIMESNMNDNISLLAPDIRGYTPIHYAMQSASYDSVVRLWVAYGLNHKPNQNEVSALVLKDIYYKLSGYALKDDKNNSPIRKMEQKIIMNHKNRDLFFQRDPEIKYLLEHYEAGILKEDNKYVKFVLYIYKNWLTHVFWKIIGNNKNIELVHLCYKYNINFNSCDENGDTYLHYCARNNLLTRFNLLLIQQNIDVNLRNLDGFTPLDEAMYGSNLDIVKILLENGADIYQIDKKKSSSLSKSLIHKKFDCAKILIDHNFEKAKNYRTKNGKTLLELMISKNISEGADFLLRTFGTSNGDEKMSSMYYAIMCNSIKCLELFLKYKMKTYDNETPKEVINTIINNNFDICLELLLAYTTETKFRNCMNESFILSSIKGNIKCSKILLKYGANINYKNNLGMNALFYNVMISNSEYVKFLLENGADANIKSDIIIDRIETDDSKIVTKYINCNSLQIAAHYGSMECIIILLKANANKNHTMKRQTIIKTSTLTDPIIITIDMTTKDIFRSSLINLFDDL